MRIFTIAAVSILIAMPAFTQDKSREVVGSDAKIVLKTTKTMVDKPISFPQMDKPEITMMVVTMEPDGHTSLHKHPSPTFGYVMEGAVEVRAEGTVKKVTAGEAFMEPIDSPMQIWNTNSVVSKLVISVVGTEGTPVAVSVK